MGRKKNLDAFTIVARTLVTLLVIIGGTGFWYLIQGYLLVVGIGASKTRLALEIITDPKLASAFEQVLEVPKAEISEPIVLTSSQTPSNEVSPPLQMIDLDHPSLPYLTEAYEIALEESAEMEAELAEAEELNDRDLIQALSAKSEEHQVEISRIMGEIEARRDEDSSKI